MSVWIIRGEPYRRLLKWLPGKVPWPMVPRVSSRQAALFLHEFARGDGHWEEPFGEVASPGKHPLVTRVAIEQRNRHMADAAQAFATIAGIRSSLNQRANGISNLRLIGKPAVWRSPSLSLE